MSRQMPHVFYKTFKTGTLRFACIVVLLQGACHADSKLLVLDEKLAEKACPQRPTRARYSQPTALTRPGFMEEGHSLHAFLSSLLIYEREMD